MKAKLFYCYQSAHEAGEKRHAQPVVRELAEQQGFTIERAQAESLYDGWVFFIACTDLPILPSFVSLRLLEEYD
jgi:hypothetical protein